MIEKGQRVILPAECGIPEQRAVVLEVQNGCLLVEIVPEDRPDDDPDGLCEVPIDFVRTL